MPEPFPHTAITASLFSNLSDEFPPGVEVAFPGVRINAADLDEWLEVSLSVWNPRPQRETALRVVNFVLTIHAFVKQRLDKARIQELADAVRLAVSGRTVPLRDHDASGTPIIGYATLFEPETRDLTRSDAEAQRHAMQHLVVTCPGIAQQV